MPSLFNRIRNSHDLIFKTFLTLLCIAAIVLIFPKEARFSYEFSVGTPWIHEELLAPFDFAILKTDEEKEAERNAIIADHRLIFNIEMAIPSAQREAFQKELDSEWSTSGPGKQGLVGKWMGRNNKIDSLSYQLHLDAGISLLDSIYGRGLLQITDEIESANSDFEITTLRDSDNLEEDREIGSFYTIAQARDYLHTALARRPSIDQEFLSDLLQDALLQNVVFNEDESDKRLQQKLDAVRPTRDLVVKDTKVIGRGEVVTEDVYRQLVSLKTEYEKQLGGSEHFYVILFGQLLLVSMSIIILMVFIGMFRKDVFEDNRKVTFILFMLVLMTLLASVARQIEQIDMWLVPLCLMPVLVRVFFDIRLAIFTHVILTTIIGFLAPNGFEYVFIQLITGIAAVFNLVSLQKRSQLFLTALIIFGVYSLAYIGFSTIQTGEINSIDPEKLAWFAGNALLTLMGYPLMYLFERMFGFLSDVTLTELSNTNNPLLRELASKTPGTFQHSMQVANLAEEAVLAVGGNPLLVRTGALYHDIGKMRHPQYFIENQQGTNPHDDLPYERSAEIIIGHVKHGIELAKKHNLPEPIIDFIRTHHGTGLVKYFYNSYKRDNPDKDIDEEQFSYPGPKPYSLESAILMMADSVEAASRSIKEPNAENLSKLVDGIIDAQAAEGQFGNAPVTFRDIETIKKLFKRLLMGIYHVRIEYPK